MQRAIALAHEHMEAGDGGPFGAVIARDGQVLADGWNQVTSTNDPTAHAEVVAIRKACQTLGTFELTGADLYASCEPCPLCLSAAYWARVERIFFASTKEDAARHGFDDAFIYQEIPKPPAERSIAMVAMPRDDATGVFTAWSAKSDKIPY